ncbi:hypothetical protein LTR78_006485 [Recurvomyces mirabilis]|uniref:Uncharacterized protein n=1 Tax=Recurvomyces mirabilis TaxID=574656 RepID=A0AAE1BZT3_9PEZI|nr:hypothetical protein LTR78_006485 [Recurvomyces mirabilis]KAK5151096.1 hypothetical protein LTS14_009592 [Recurvomyces mirabilis]
MRRRSKWTKSTESDEVEGHSDASSNIVVAIAEYRHHLKAQSQTQTRTVDQDLPSEHRRSERLRSRVDANRVAPAQNLSSQSRGRMRDLHPEIVDPATDPPDPPLMRRGFYTSVEEAGSELMRANAILAERREVELERISGSKKGRERERKRVRHDERWKIWDEETLYGFGPRVELSEEAGEDAGAPAQAQVQVQVQARTLRAVSGFNAEVTAGEGSSAVENPEPAQEDPSVGGDDMPEQVDDDETGDYDVDEDLYS